MLRNFLNYKSFEPIKFQEDFNLNVLKYNKISQHVLQKKNLVFLYTSISIKRFTRSFPFLWKGVLDKLILHEDSKGQELPQTFRYLLSDTPFRWRVITLQSQPDQYTGCPKKHGNSVTNWITSLLWISIVIPNFKSQNIIMSARLYFMKRVKDCKDVSIMSPQDEQWRLTSLLCLYAAIFLFY